MKHPTAACMALFVGTMVTASCQKPIVIHTAEKSSPTESKERQISVQGSAEQELRPDRLDLRVVIKEVHASPARAVRKMRQKQEAMQAAVTKLGVSDTELVLSSLRLSDHYERVGDRSVKMGFVAASTVTITMQDFDRIGDYMQIGSDHGAENMSTLFRNTELVAKKAETRKLAIEAAKSKAAQMIELAGGRLGAVIAIAEGSASANYWAPQQLANTVVSAQPSAPVRTGSALTLRMSVSITFEFRS